MFRRTKTPPPYPPTNTPFVRRRRRTAFKVIITGATLIVALGLISVFEGGRHLLQSLPTIVATFFRQQRDSVVRLVTGLQPTREEIDATNRLKREQSRLDTLRSVTRYYNSAPPAMKRLFDVAGMAPADCIIGVGRATNGFLLSSRVFELDDQGRAYRLRPNVTSVWLRQLTLIDGPFALFLVPDTPEVREAAGAAGAIVDNTSRQTTNSWGLRGPEPDPSAEVRGVVLGDSFMQGMFNDDDHTPPRDLERVLADTWKCSLSLLNTGHIGYAPEQYCATLRALGPKFQPHFVLVSVCPNDFGDGDEVILGRGDGWEEAEYWLGEILQWCRSRNVPCMLVPAPLDRYILGVRKDAWYPGRIANLYPGPSMSYCNPFEYFVEAHLEARRAGSPAGKSPLFNHQINDNHFSPEGSALWARVVGQRLVAIMKRTAPSSSTSKAPGSAH